MLRSEGDTSDLDLAALSALVARGEAGTAWSLAHRTGFLLGHMGDRAALVAAFADRPGHHAAVTLRASLASLEQRGQLLNAPDKPEVHTALVAYLRAVRLLLLRETGVTLRSRG
jgi:hypothetical protein